MIKSALLLVLSTSTLLSSTFSYNIGVNTSSLSGTTGTLYFQFNPGDVSSDAATAVLSNFQVTAPGVLAGAPSLSGGGSGSLASSLAIANVGSNNDALQALTFGSSLSFRLTLNETFTGSATTGSVFNFGVFQNDGFTPLLTQNSDGYSIIVNLDNANRASAATTTVNATIAPVTTATPEPATAALFLAGTGALWFARRQKTR